jgi:hypothetical protein
MNYYAMCAELSTAIMKDLSTRPLSDTLQNQIDTIGTGTDGEIVYTYKQMKQQQLDDLDEFDEIRIKLAKFINKHFPDHAKQHFAHVIAAMSSN